ncbi:hypothetical protein B9Z55_003351 [Caenorhabditis nigoni]|uniref:Tc3 transposase DNA binding domain-containing protein n=1 Tax=Caenorhabditis nigoni TaxID=1611254 RepID=A0A2G5VQ53_9PELO|nr:hypothetical protein B9Z55_003351 [Caenorhabditis nigoni]
MRSGSTLSDYEKGQIDARKLQGYSNKKIAKDIGRSHTIVNSYINDPIGYGTRKSPGRPELLTRRDKRMIIRNASNAVTTCRKIKATLNLGVSEETVRRVITKSKFMKYRKMKKVPHLTNQHRLNRVEFARKNTRIDWRKVRLKLNKQLNKHRNPESGIIFPESGIRNNFLGIRNPE